MQVPWLSSTTISRFAYSECEEKRTWQQLGREYVNIPHMFSMGGLGPLSTEEFDQWVCIRDHACLQKVKASEQEFMCYVFHETENKWYPWALQSEIKQTCMKF
jgi:hypothetical protein